LQLACPAASHQDIEHVPVLINGSPQVVMLAFNGKKHLIEMPFVARAGTSPPQLVGTRL
jgi:hypothetical protein